jgi:hypothetical protein
LDKNCIGNIRGIGKKEISAFLFHGGRQNEAAADNIERQLGVKNGGLKPAVFKILIEASS